MIESSFYKELAARFRGIVEENGLLDETIEVSGRAISPEEAIGKPLRDDYPILKGKEQLMQAVFRGEKGQAFTDMPGVFSGSISEILDRPLETNFDTAVLISTVNAVCRHLNIAGQTVHCKDEEPERCAEELVRYIRKTYGSPKVALVGLQPAMLQKLSGHFSVRAVDLDEEQIGQVRFGVRIGDGKKETDGVLAWCDLILATGSTAANGSITRFLGEKPVLFFGTTVAGAAALMSLDRFCACGT